MRHAALIMVIAAMFLAGCVFFPAEETTIPDSNENNEPGDTPGDDEPGMNEPECVADSDCDDRDDSTFDECTQNECSHTAITICIGSDFYCPEGCNHTNDSDCEIASCSAQGGEVCAGNETCPTGFIASTDSQRCCALECEFSPECANNSECDDDDPSTDDKCSASKCEHEELTGLAHTYNREKGGVFLVKGAGAYDGDDLEVEIVDIYAEAGELFGLFRLSGEDSVIATRSQGEGELTFRGEDGKRLAASVIEIEEISEEDSSERAVEITNELENSYEEDDSFVVEGAGTYRREKLSVVVEEISSQEVVLLLYSGSTLIGETSVGEDDEASFEDEYGSIVKTEITVIDLDGDSVDIETRTESEYFEATSSRSSPMKAPMIQAFPSRRGTSHCALRSTMRVSRSGTMVRSSLASSTWKKGRASSIMRMITTNSNSRITLFFQGTRTMECYPSP